MIQIRNLIAEDAANFWKLRLQLSVAQVNQKAIRFYQSFGFESFAVIPRVVFWNGVFYDDEEMIKYLDN